MTTNVIDHRRRVVWWVNFDVVRKKIAEKQAAVHLIAPYRNRNPVGSIVVLLEDKLLAIRWLAPESLEQLREDELILMNRTFEVTVVTSSAR